MRQLVSISSLKTRTTILEERIVLVFTVERMKYDTENEFPPIAQGFLITLRHKKSPFHVQTMRNMKT